MRLDRFISGNTGLSRSQVQRLLKAGSVAVDGERHNKGDFKLGPDNRVTLDGEIISAVAPCYLMLNKPPGFVCTAVDPHHPSVFELVEDSPLIPAANWQDLQIVGRLDVDTTGLLLLTDDGAWNHRLSSPKSGTGKCYRVSLAEAISDEQIAQLQAGILLRSESKATLPCDITRRATHCVEITVFEGKYHQVKRMFAAVGNRVTALHRFRVGPFQLDETLNEGEFRLLSAQESAQV